MILANMRWPLTPTQKQLLQDVAAGHVLKDHRYLDGRKLFRLHYLDDRSPRAINRLTLFILLQRGLLASNKKFPAATYLLTDKGRRYLTDYKTTAHGPHNYPNP
ncbi:MAG TPA: hypothetical protein VLL52_01485 [Anaerolineae bacterium]|nr:hypothetical protein [Anaerolineae bacterium]